MPPTTARPRFSPELRASAFHFTVFGTNGLANVYLAIWLSNRGISPDEIGIVNAAPVLGMLAVNIVAGRLADRARDWRSAIAALALIGGVVPIGLFFVSGFWGILAIWMLSVLPAFSLVPVLDAATLRMTRRRGTDFGRVRAWGTVGFMIASALCGPALAWFGDGAFVPLFVFLAAGRALLSLQLPRFRDPGYGEAPEAGSGSARNLRQILRPWFVLTLLSLGIVYSTHGALGAFGSLLWQRQGISPALIGPLVAVMAASEATTMFLWTRLKVRASARHLILFSCLVAAFRWAVMAFSPPVWLLFGLQCLHSITFAVSYFGGIYFIGNWTNEAIAAEAQGFSYVIQQVMSVVAVLGMGWAVAAFGAYAWLVLAGYSLCGALLVVLSLRLMGPSPEPHPADVPAVVAARPEILP